MTRLFLLLVLLVLSLHSFGQQDVEVVPANGTSFVVKDASGLNKTLEVTSDGEILFSGRQAFPESLLIGRNPADISQSIIIGRVESTSDNYAWTLIEYESKTYRIIVRSDGNSTGIVGELGVQSDTYYSDPACTNIVGASTALVPTIVGVYDSPFLYSLDPENYVLFGLTQYYSYGWPECQAVNTNGDLKDLWLFPYTKLQITAQELLNGAIPPYSVIYD